MGELPGHNRDRVVGYRESESSRETGNNEELGELGRLTKDFSVGRDVAETGMIRLVQANHGNVFGRPSF